MAIEEETIKQVALVLLIILCVVISIIVLNALTGGRLVRSIVCGALFWMPLGALATAMTQGCAAIPV